ncbi:ABC transporter ATP-binding protein [Pelagibacterium halotolerans]|uniref:Glycerol-3-phosphate ABC transporter, ATP-binding protein UgpC n=1 Tax=Pelagibacterium halotolerans (strain DSM 22347 / JCM 15775 / CGMCC 1.7692 / B2) TaxID=1082931 RepID=G4REL7_PELHB|nr:ABC transporter ATP-binding protein [Pelagibacterium halotolerans]AEQ50867.1 glycerol-3-phosphate ABC transporter, ATP-binding protein UgpC [Pelagibacterium halotolerans B2]QJR19223.1 ABC transporter ATP-binding protein [Pelagibacterium halotolerans]SDZ98417.1 carbohydrate ABC transporter ATP-binding protein, CUT1 family [Pelagibacterium halotolerans]
MERLSLKDVKKNFGSTEVIKSVNLSVDDGEFVVFVGPSGCGKSTLLRMIAGLDHVTDGTIAIDGDDVTGMLPLDRGVAMVFQSYALYPHMNVADNIGFGLRIQGMKKAERDAKVAEAARTLQLEPLLARKPKALSGGQRQRVAIGRAIVKNPKIFLFDEPLSNLDAELRVQMRLEIARLHTELGATMIYVTHDQVEAMTLADKIVVLRDGRVEQVGRPIDLYEDPDNMFVAGFIGSPKMNFVSGTVVETSDEGIKVKVPEMGDVLLTVRPRAEHRATGSGVRVGFRPEHCAITETGIAATVRVTEQLGNLSYLYLDTAGGGSLTVEQRRLTAHRPGAQVFVTPETDHILAFDSEGRRI